MVTVDNFERDFVVMNLDDGNEMLANAKNVAYGQFKFNRLHARPP